MVRRKLTPVTKQLLSLFLFALLLNVGAAAASEVREFKHPGVPSTQSDLSSLRERVNSNACARMGFERLKSSRYADLERPHTPYATVSVVAGKGNKYEAAFRGDAQAAHATALMWVITGDLRYRDKSMAILDDWAATYRDIKVARGNPSQAYLEAAWAAPIWTAAADIIRYYDNGAAGWNPDRMAAFDQFLDRLVSTARGARQRDDNWGTSATLAIMAAAVYREDAAAYAEAVKLYASRLSAISRKSGVLKSDEYLRDPLHPQYTILAWIQAGEIAWNQGDDLYGLQLDGQPQPRLALILEHFATLFLGELPDPAGLKMGKYRDSHKNRQGYDMAFNHYIGRQGMASSMPSFARMVPTWRPGGIDELFVAWDTLSHSEHCFQEQDVTPSLQQTPNGADAGDSQKLSAGPQN